MKTLSMDFDYINDEKFRTILKRDFEELNKCLEIRASKAVLILSGSIIESVLIDFFTNFPPDNITQKKVLTMDLSALIDHATDHKLISQSSKDLSTVIRNFRNLIHPGREVRKKQSFDYDSAVVAKSLLNIILKEIKENYMNNLGYSCLDILVKLENDAVSESIFEKILTKVHKSERTKLYKLLIEYDLNLNNNQISQLSDPKKYIHILKSQIEKEVIVKQLFQLVNKIETGEKWEIMIYFNLLFDDLNFLDEKNIELILVYVLNALTDSTAREDEMRHYSDKKLFSTFGKHLVSEDIKKEFIELACKIVQRFSICDYIYFTAYDQLINSLDSDKREKVKEYILKNVSSYSTEKFYVGYNNGDFLPF